MLKVLVITRSEWSDDNSLGNTLSNLLGGDSDLDIANLYFRSAKPKNNVCRRYFSLTELSQLFRRGRAFEIHKQPPLRRHADVDPSEPAAPSYGARGSLPSARQIERALLAHLRSLDSALPLVLQDLFWRVGLWRGGGLLSFVDDFCPDVIFFPSFHTPYVHRVVSFIAKRTGSKIVAFHTDDYVSETYTPFSPLRNYYNRLRREHVLATARAASLNYCITSLQAGALRKLVPGEFKVLHKGADLSDSDYLADESNRCDEEAARTLKIVYAGFLLHGRWKTLQLLVESVAKLTGPPPFAIDIYSQYYPPEAVLNAIVRPGVSSFHGAVSNGQVKEILRKADLALHVESFHHEDIASTQCSFSTKIVDCLASSACVFAIGPSNIASIDYLKSGDMAIVIDDPARLPSVLRAIASGSIPLSKLKRRAHSFVKEHHDLAVIRRLLRADLSAVAKTPGHARKETDMGVVP